MSLLCIKVLEWLVEDKIILKIESINSYLNPQAEVKEYELETGLLRIAETKESDMKWEEDAKELLLLDNTDYWVTYRCGLLDRRILTDLLKNPLDGRGILNSNNYIGKLDIGINEFSIVVKSKKVNYDRDFNFLRKSIANFCSDLLSRSSSYYAEHFSKAEHFHSEKTNYSELAYLKDILSPDKLPSWIDYFLYHAEHVYEKNIGICSLSEVEDIEADFYLNGLLSGNLFKTEKAVGRAGSFGKAPNEIENYEYNMTYDTNENRFVKFFVFYLRDYLSELYWNVSENNNKLKNELVKMQQIINERIENPFWKKISKMERIPFNSQVLQKKYPYNLIFQAYTEFQLASEINLGELDKKYVVGQKDAPMLYQYWVFIMLFKHLVQKYEEKYVTSDWIVYDGKNLTFTLIEGRESFAKFFVDEEMEIHLLYNKTYDSRHTIWAGRSYSHELKPDISIEMFKNGDLVSIIHFDAKYKLPNNGMDVPDDINKMHAYKDGILGTIGAYAICLTDQKIIYHEEEKGWEERALFPSVGACPLNLNPERLKEELDDIMHIVDEFTKIDPMNDANRFSEKNLVSYHSLMRKMMKVEE